MQYEQYVLFCSNVFFCRARKYLISMSNNDKFRRFSVEFVENLSEIVSRLANLKVILDLTVLVNSSSIPIILANLAIVIFYYHLEIKCQIKAKELD